MTPSTPNTADLGELVEELRQRSLARVATAPNPKRLSANARCDIRLHNAAADLLTAQQREIEEWRKCYSDRIEAERATIRAEAEAEVAELRAQLSALTPELIALGEAAVRYETLGVELPTRRAADLHDAARAYAASVASISTKPGGR